MSRLAALLALALLLGTISACDLFGGFGLTPPSDPVALPPYAASVIDLDELLGIDAGPELNLRLASVEGGVAAQTLPGRRLAVEPTAVGAGTVRLEAIEGGAVLDSVDIPFVVSDPGPLTNPPAVTVTPNESAAFDLSELFRPTDGGTPPFEIASVSGPVTLSVDGSILRVLGVEAGEGVVVIRSTRFVPQELTLGVTVE